MVRPVVLIDVDGVIADFTEIYLRCAVEARVIGPEFACTFEPKQWDMGDALGLTIDGRKAVHNRLFEMGVAQSMQPLPGAVTAVKELMLLADVYFPTSPIYESPTWEYDRWQWFKKHFDKDAADRLIFTKKKHLISGDFFVDDKYEHVEAWGSRWGRTAVLWPQPYNRDCKVDLSVVAPPTANWRLLLNLVKGGQNITRGGA